MSQLSQSTYWRTAPGQDGSHVTTYYDSQGRPTVMAVTETGKFMTITWDATNPQATVALYDANGSFLQGGVVQGNGSGYTVTALSTAPQLRVSPNIRAVATSMDQAELATRTVASNFDSTLVQTFYGVANPFYTNSPWFMTFMTDLNNPGTPAYNIFSVAGVNAISAHLATNPHFVPEFGTILLALAAIYCGSVFLKYVLFPYINKTFTNPQQTVHDGSIVADPPFQPNPPQPSPSSSSSSNAKYNVYVWLPPGASGQESVVSSDSGGEVSEAAGIGYAIGELQAQGFLPSNAAFVGINIINGPPPWANG